MQIIRRFFSFLFLCLLLLSGCASVISSNLKAKVDSALTFREVFQNPDAYEGKTVLWGGRIIQILPQDDTTYVEILQMPLGWRKKPEEAYASEGKFLILIKKLLDLSDFDRGKKITVAGEIQGSAQRGKIESLSERDYRYPVILSEELHLWKDYLYPYSSSVRPYTGPTWYDPAQRGPRF